MVRNAPPRRRIDRPVGDGVALLEASVVLALDDRDELHVAQAEHVAEVAVDVEGVGLVGGVHGAQHVHVDAAVLQVRQAAQDPFRARAALLVDPVPVVQLGWSVDAQPDEEPVLGQELGPLVGEQRAVRLDGVQKPLAGAAETFGERDRVAEEVDPHQGRLTALPRHDHLAVGL